MNTPLHPRRRLNAKRLLCVLLPAALLAAGMHFLHAAQVRRSARSLLWQAERAEAQADLPTAARYLSRYLNLVPSDSEALARYGLHLDQLAQSNQARLQAWQVLEQALRRDPQRRQLRRRLACLAMSLGRFADAGNHLQTLLKARPEDGELEQLLGDCEAAQGRYDRAANCWQKAIRHRPSQVESYIRLADLLHTRPELAARANQRRPELTAVLAAAPQALFPACLPWPALASLDSRTWPHPGEAVINSLVAANPCSFQAHLVRARYRRQFNRAGAEDDLARAQELAPRDLEVLAAAAQFARHKGHYDEARAYLRRGLKLCPENAALYQSLARLELHTGRRRQAAACLRQGVKAVLDNPKALWTAADLFIDAGAPADARDLIARLRARNFPLERLDYLEARLEIARGEWLKTATILERIRPQLAESARLTRQTDLLLGRCYEQLGNPDLQLAAFRHALAVDSSWLPARLGLAGALQALGKTDEALAQYRQLSRQTLEGRVVLARLLIERNLRLPEAQRRAPGPWKEVDRLLNEAGQIKPAAGEVALLRAQARIGQNQLDEARAVLEAARARQPDQVEFWVALADLAQQRGETSKALRLLEGARRQLGDSVAMRLAQARHWARQRGAQARAGLRELETGLDNFSPADQLRLLRGLASAHYQVGDRRATQRLVRQLAQRQPNELRSRLLLFDLVQQANNETGLRQVLSEVKRIEGDGGVFWRYGEAALLVLRARRNHQPAPAAARKYLEEVAARRPGWGRVALLEAEIEELEGNSERAIPRYQRALDLGERQPDAVRRLVQLLTERQRYAEANQVVQKMLEETGTPGYLGRLAAELAVCSQDYQAALELAKQAVPANSRRYNDHIWLGLIEWASRDQRSAETELRRAVQLAGRVPAPWVALVQFLAGTGQTKKAAAALEEARRQLPADRAPLALARCYEVLGQPVHAEQEYRKALAARPGDPQVLRDTATFYLDHQQPRQAEPHLRRLIDPASKATREDAAWARRSLALALARGGNYRGFHEALALLEGNSKATAASVEDQRARALVLATQPRRRSEAIRLLEDLVKRQTSHRDDQFLLARLYEAVGQWSRARDKMLNLLGETRDQPLYLAHFADSLLRRGQPEDAQVWLARLEELQPKAFATVNLKARLFQARKQTEEAVAVLERYARTRPEDAGRAAGLLAELGQAAAAEKMYRRHVAQAQDPCAVLALAEHLGRQQRLAEALDLCAPAWQTCPVEVVAGTCLAVIYNGRADQPAFRRVERWLRRALAKDARNSTLTLCLANLKDLEGRHGEAKALFRQVLQRDRRHTPALNNLAWVLALHDSHGEEALSLINRAIAVDGPRPDLLDTRGVLHLTLGRTRSAIKDLEEATAEAPSAAKYFHLAQAHQRARDRQAARKAWHKALALGLKETTLHPLEHPAYRQLLRELR